MKSKLVVALLGLGLSISAHSYASICNRELLPQRSMSTTTERAFAKFFYKEEAFQPGNCAENLKSLIEYLKAHDPSFKPRTAKVLTIYRFDPDAKKEPFSTQNLVMTGLREIETEKYTFHVVLEVDGKIYDTAFGNKPSILSQEDYFDAAFIESGPITRYSRRNLSPIKEARFIDQLNYYRIADQRTLYHEVRVRAMSASEYLETHYHKLVDEKNSGSTYVWRTADEDFASDLLGNYLAPGWTKPSPLPKGSTKKPGSYVPPQLAFSFPGGVQVFVEDELLAAGDIRQTPNALRVERSGQEFPRIYNRTDRDIELLKNFYTNELLAEEGLKDKIVVDMAAGGGQFVEELRAKGVAAYGVDIALHSRQLKHVFATQEGRKKLEPIQLTRSSAGNRFLIHADAANTGILAETVDIIYDTYGIFDYNFRYGSEGEADVFSQALKEWKRILKIGGVIRIAPANPYYIELLRAYFTKSGEFSEPKYFYPNPESEVGSLEITRIK